MSVEKDSLVAALLILSADDRLEVFSNFCRDCGRYLRKKERCYCARDD